MWRWISGGLAHLRAMVRGELVRRTGAACWCPGLCHGFVTLQHDTEICYKCTAPYAPDCDGAIAWTIRHWGGLGCSEPVLSDKDAQAGPLAKVGTPFMKLLVTGGAGFIGSAVVRAAIAQGHSVVNLDALTYAACLDNVASVADHPELRLCQADICDRAALDRTLADHAPDAIMHLAAESHVDRSIDGPGALSRPISPALTRCWKLPAAYWIAQGKPHSFRFHHVSTMRSLALLAPRACSPKTRPIDPSSPYSASKAASDHLGARMGETYGLPVVLTNCSNNYGPFHFPEKLVPVVILNALAGEPIPIYGQGENVRDWLYVEDHADALADGAGKGALAAVYNIGGENEARNIDLVRMICALLDDCAPRHAYADLITFVTDRPGP